MQYIVLRKCPPELANLEGYWYNVTDSQKIADTAVKLTNALEHTFWPTDRYETREDGERAEVYAPKEQA